MASKRKAFLSRSVSLSLAALIVLTGAMFLITTLEHDHQEWKLVEDEVISLSFVGYTSADTVSEADYDFSFDEETSTYSLVVTGGTKAASSVNNVYYFSVNDSFDYSKNYRFDIVSSDLPFVDFGFKSGVVGESLFNLRSVQSAEDGSYSASVVLYDQYVTDLSFKENFNLNCKGPESATFSENSIALRVYTLEDDNAGSVAAAITGLTLIVMGVFATPMLNVFRRR